MLAKDNKFHARTYRPVLPLCSWGSRRWENKNGIHTNFWEHHGHLHESSGKAEILGVCGMLSLVIMKEWRASTSLFQDKQGWPYQELSHDQHVYTHLNKQAFSSRGSVGYGYKLGLFVFPLFCSLHTFFITYLTHSYIILTICQHLVYSCSLNLLQKLRCEFTYLLLDTLY